MLSHDAPHHVLRAEDLARWLAQSPPEGCGAKEEVAPASFQRILAGRTGVLFFKDYWQRGNETFESRSGDHIDLWKSSRITSASMMMRNVQEFLGLVSDLNKSKAVWFWEVR